MGKINQDLARETETDGVFDMLSADTLITQILNDSGHEDPNIWRDEIQIEQDPSEGSKKIIDYFIKEDPQKL